MEEASRHFASQYSSSSTPGSGLRVPIVKTGRSFCPTVSIMATLLKLIVITSM
jgi:hypothetical protein